MEADIAAIMVVAAAVAAEATTITTEVVEEEATVVVEVTEAVVEVVDTVSTEEEVEAIVDTTATAVVVDMAIDTLQGRNSSRNSLTNLMKTITNNSSHLKFHNIDLVEKLLLLNLSSKKVMAEIWHTGTNMLKKNSQMKKKNKSKLSGLVLQTEAYLRRDISSSMYSKKKFRKVVRKAKRKIAHLV